jgi:pilus assembly protein CpaD
MIERDAMRLACLMAVLLAGSCTSDREDKPGIFQDGATNHPIAVEAGYRTLKIGDAATLSGADAASVETFVENFLAHGTGSISVQAPAGPDAQHVVASLGEALANMGVPRSRILVGIKDPSDGDGHVEIGYIGYEARTDACGDWSENVGDTYENRAMPNFGCAVQQNIAAQVVDPRDLAQSRTPDPADANRRTQVLSKYEQGQPTGTPKTKEQSGAVSDVNNGQ